MNERRRLSITLCLALLPQLAVAQDSLEVASEEEEVDEWTALDMEFQGLEALELEYEPLAEIWGYGRSNVYYDKDDNHGALNLDNLRVNLVGQLAGYDYRLTSELASGSLELLDAWMTTGIGEEFGFTLGQFKTPFLRSGMLEACDLLMIARTRNGIFYATRDQGVMVNGDHGRFHWALAAQNGASAQFEQMLTTAHAKVDIIGQPEMAHEGAYGSGGTTRLTVGAGISNDDASSDGTAFALEANFVNKRFCLQAEWLDYGDDYSFLDTEQRGGTSPWSVTASYMLVLQKYELALRYDDFDDVSEPMEYSRRVLTAGLNRYIQGHDLKWQLNVASAHKGGGDDGPHDLLVALGVTYSF
jgi:hypothetical protein